MYSAVVCDVLGLDYEQYLKQPKWLIELRMRKKAADREYIDKNTKT